MPAYDVVHQIGKHPEACDDDMMRKWLLMGLLLLVEAHHRGLPPPFVEAADRS